MKSKLIITLFAVVFGVVAFKLYKEVQKQKMVPEDRIIVSGTIEATEIRLSFRIPGKIKEILKIEGDRINRGERIASLDKEELIAIKAQSEAAVKEAELAYERLKEDYGRAENLFQAGAVPEQQRDAVKTNYGIAKSKWETLKAALELAGIRLGFTDLISPSDGYVMVKSAEVGEVIQTGAPVLTAIDLDNVWLTAYVGSADLGRIKIGQAADIKIDTFPEKVYKGKISFISQEAEFTPKHIQTKEERTKLVYRIRINLDNSEQELKPGMPADAFIHTK